MNNLNAADIKKIESRMKNTGFSGRIRYVDCVGWKRKFCSKELREIMTG